MKPKDIETELSAEVLRSLVRYEPETGKFFALHETGRFQVRLCIGNGKSKHLGLFDTIEEASEVYRRAVIEKYGEFARL